MRLALPHDPQSPALARGWVRQLLEQPPPGGATPGAVPDVVDTVEILTSELVTNAVLHGRSMVVVQFAVVLGTIEILVEDTSSVPPRSSDTEQLAEGGRGLLLIDELASSWGWELTDTGKYVWFRLDLVG